MHALQLMSQVAEIYRTGDTGVRIKVAGFKLHMAEFVGDAEDNPASKTVLQTYQEWLGSLGTWLWRVHLRRDRGGLC